MPINLEHLLARQQRGNLAILNDVILLLELIILFSCLQVLPANHSEAALAIDVLNGVMSTDEMLLHGVALYHILYIRSEERLS